MDKADFVIVAATAFYDKLKKEFCMKKDYAHLCIILDSSGSMSCVKKETIGSFNGFIEKQKKFPGMTTFDLFQFASEVNRKVNFVDLSQNQKDLMSEYECCGMTALFDAICTAVDTVGDDLAKMQEQDRPENVLVAIITDGEENSSRKFSLQDVRNRIEHQTNVYNWEFIFLGANIDVFSTGREMGLKKDDCITFVQTPDGMAEMSERLMERAASNRKRPRK